ncbi:MAG: hypothetical protein HRU14_11465 [Planctomycetes bacterium]|nr:hypothetical protein [Planctomycetota bacterium]
MNLALFRSSWAIVAALLSGGFVVWLTLTGASAGSRAGSDVTILLASGWTTLAIMIAVCLYSLRKFVHKLGISPEFKMKTSLDKLEQAEQELNEIRRRILLGLLSDEDEIRDAAQRILESTGVDRICRATVTKNPSMGPSFIVGVEPTEPLGRMSKWLHFHVYIGLASGVLLWVHGGLSMASPMGVILNGLAALVIVTGVIGTFLFALGPRWMTRAEKDMNYEEAFVLERSLESKIRDAYGALKPEQVRRFSRVGKTTGSAQAQRTALLQVIETEPESREEFADVMVLVSQRKRILHDLRGAARIKFVINIWRALHVPASLLLIGFSVVHTVSVIWY